MRPPPPRPIDPGRTGLALPVVAAAFGIGLLLALTTSGGIVGERISRGAFAMGLAASTAATIAGLLAVLAMTRRTPALVVPQIVGAIAGIALVHLLLRRGALGTMPWLSETPAQLVNDAVAAFGLLALVWACAHGLDVRLLVFAFLGVTVYRATASMWHVDLAPGGFHSTVQELVVAQFVAAAFALGLFRATLDRGVG